DPTILQVAGIERATTVIACTGDDGRNTEIALRAKDLVAGRPEGNGLLILPEVRNDWLFTKLVNHTQQVLGSAEADIRFFNTYENTARMLLSKLVTPPSPDLAAGAFLVVGFGAMGREITQQIVRSALAPLDEKTKLIICDRDIEKAEKFLKANCPM